MGRGGGGGRLEFKLSGNVENVEEKKRVLRLVLPSILKNIYI